MYAAEYPERLEVALGEQDDLVRRGEVGVIQLARPPLGVRVQPLEQGVGPVLPQQREPQGDDGVEVGGGGGANG